MEELTPPVTPPRSTFVTVIAWIFIALAGMATPISILQNIMVWTVFRQHDLSEASATMAEQGTPAPMAWMMGHMEVWFGAFLVVCLVTLASAIGLLLRKNWGRLGFMGIMGLGILYQVVALLMMWSMTSSMPVMESAPELNTMMVVMQLFAMVFALGIVTLFGWIIKRLASPAIRAEFA